MNRYRSVFLILILIITTTPIFAQIVVEDAGYVWDSVLESPQSLPEIPSWIKVEYATNIYERILSYPQDIITVTEDVRSRIVEEYATNIYVNQLIYPEAIIVATDTVPPRIVVEYATYIAGENLFSSDIGNTDYDNDGMPNMWEADYGLDPTDPTDAAADGDSDGLNNLEEFQNGTDPADSDNDDDGVTDGDEVNYGNDPLGVDAVDLNITSCDVVVSLTGDNRIFVELINGFCIPKGVYVSLTGIDAGWYTIEPEDQNFVMMPFARKKVTIQLHLPEDCNIPTQEYPFHVEAAWQHGGQAYVSADDANLIVTPNPNIYPLTIPSDNRMAGNTIFVAWKTDIPASSTLFYRKLGDETFIEMPVAVDATEHIIMLTDLEYFTYYEMYTESQSSCGGVATTGPDLVKTGKAVKFVQNVNEFWVDRDYNQLVTTTVTNTDMIPHTFELSVINDNEDIVVGFVGDGTPGREVSLEPGESTDVELMVHAPDAQKTQYDIYLKMVSDPQEDDTFEDYSHAIVHVRPFVANLDIQPVESTPGLMTNKYRLMNYGDTLTDIEVYVDEDNRTKTWMNPVINHTRLVNGEYVEFDLQAQEYTTGALYARSGEYVVSVPFEIGCPPDTELTTYTLNDFSITAEIKDWYCTNKMQLELPFALPRGFGYDDIDSAALEVNFSLPMGPEKYDPHTVDISINGTRIALLENVIPQGQYIYRIPVTSLHLGPESSAENILSLNIEGITEGQYIVASDFKVILNIDEMQIDLCVPPPIPQVKIPPPDPETKIIDLGPKNKYRPGDVVDHLKVMLTNNGDDTHSGILTLTLENNSFNGEVQPDVFVETIDVPTGTHVFPDDFAIDLERYIYTIPADADDIEYTLSATFENITMNASYSVNDRPGFYVRTPLIIIHGIAGSELVNTETDEQVWGFPEMYISQFKADLTCDENGQSVYPIVSSSVLKSILKSKTIENPLEIDIFDGLEEHLRKQNYVFHRIGSEDDFNLDDFDPGSDYPEDVFYFVYDWRLSNVYNATILSQFIDKLTQRNGTKVNIAAHSMGGIVVKSLLKNNPSQNNVINKLLFIGTPHLGSVDAFSGIMYGINNFHLLESEFKPLAENMSSIYQLLPSNNYFDNYSHYYQLSHYGVDLEPITLSTTPSIDYFIETEGNPTLLQNAKILHTGIESESGIDDLDITAFTPLKSYAIAGCKCFTESLITEDIETSEISFEDYDGDGTVQLLSAVGANVDRIYTAQYAEHANLPSQPGVRLLVRSLLKGYEENFQTDLLHPVAEYCDGYCGLPEGMTIVLPPFTLPDIQWPKIRLVGGDSGEFVWKTGNGVYLGILGSDYRITNEGVEIFVPEGSVYTLDFHGIDQEYLDIKFRLMTEGGIIQTYVFANITLDMGACGAVDFDLTSALTNPVLRLDHECDGVFEEGGIEPSYVLNETESDDLTAPTTIADIVGTQGENDWYTSDVSITLNATDNTGGSGILCTRYRFQDDSTFTNYSGPINITEPGEYTLTFFSIDRNLNRETEQVVIIKIDSVMPQVINVQDQGYYTLGLASFSATWEVTTGISGLQDIRYSLGTAPGLNNVVDWTSAGAITDISLTGLSLAETCSEQYYINIQAVNGAGLESDIVSSDGVIALGEGGDPDADGFINEAELTAGSNPCNVHSIPGDSSLHLIPGFNVVSIPADTYLQPDLKDWLVVLGGSSEIDRVMAYDEQAGSYITLVPGSSSNPSMILQGGEGIIVYAIQEKDIPFTSLLCNPIDLLTGFNSVGFACVPDGYSAFDLLTALGSDNAISIQRFDAETGIFESAGFNADNQPTGIDFAIVPGEGYFIYMKQEVVELILQ